MNKIKKYILYGCGWRGEQFWYNFRNVEIEYCIDREIEVFHEKKVFRIEDAPNIEKYIIIVAMDGAYYREVSKLLKKKGLVEFHNFINYKAFNKKVVIINTNCYGIVYKDFLCKSSEFMQRYYVYELPWIHNNMDGIIPSEALEACDLYIHQDIRADNSYSYRLSDEYILPKLKKDCLKFTVPNLVGMGKWCFPQDNNYRKKKKIGSREVSLFMGDSLIDSAYNKKKDINYIRKSYMDVMAIPKEYVEHLFKEFFVKLIMREQMWDVKISDFIFENYKYMKIFYDSNHPTEIVMREICRRMAKKLGINDVDNAMINYSLNWLEGFVLPTVKEALGCTFVEKYIRNDKNNFLHLSNKKLDLDEYIREYIYWTYDDKI